MKKIAAMLFLIGVLGVPNVWAAGQLVPTKMMAQQVHRAISTAITRT